MSSTNVHSENEKVNIECVGGQTIPTENELEMPPKSAGRGPSILDVRQGETMEIPVGDSVLHKDGKLIAVGGTTVAKFDKTSFDRIAAKHAKRNNEKRHTRGQNANKGTRTIKGEDR